MMQARLAKPEESETIIKWMDEQDPGSMYLIGKNTMTLVAENGKLRGCLPIRAVFFIDSMAHNPENRHRDTVHALVALLDSAVNMAKGLEVKELYFVATTKEIEKQAEDFGFYRIPFPVYRRRLP